MPRESTPSATASGGAPPAAHARAVRRTVRFSDCDPAGIAFFPQLLVMLNDAVEEWFDSVLGVPYAQLVGERRIGLPTVRLEVDYLAINRHGDELALHFEVERLGRASLVLRCSYRAGDELRVQVRQVLVCTSLRDHRPVPLPDDVRAALARYAANGAGATDPQPPPR